MPYEFKTKGGGIYSASCRRPPRANIDPLKDSCFQSLLLRMSKCIAHSIRKESDEILVWYFENSTFLAPEQASKLHTFLCNAKDVEMSYVSMDRRTLIIKTSHGEELTVMLACKHSRFYIEPPPERAGMHDVLMEMASLPSFCQNEQADEQVQAAEDGPSVIDLLSPCSAAGSEFTLESME
ncbi:hypothetical protein SEMRO_1297_G260550.1 [Seminavis robusta]|uniref:Uncharacterized protein n=1 Tax=Seminavis robusta TaxID=568900 RepID=A0A9N8EJC9_9STRA|nr:hypothetical protein SEMRO_1297_G260550.1 [Seminavis robusta]|eukprot:Sro1297_g260550.1 n/a (181) ;mRNA; r:30483-31025